jgi:murein DD-endopeptidase MepM/ murein hydrolase activator NlpD
MPDSSSLTIFPVVLDPPNHVPSQKSDGTPCNQPRIWWTDWHNVNRGSHMHHAQDIFAPKGALVVSMGPGEAEVGNSERGGKWVKVYGPYGKLYYAHLDAVFVESGEQVEAGTALGRVGQTGNATRTCPHLHIQWTAPPRSSPRHNLAPVLNDARHLPAPAIKSPSGGIDKDTAPISTRMKIGLTVVAALGAFGVWKWRMDR